MDAINRSASCDTALIIIAIFKSPVVALSSDSADDTQLQNTRPRNLINLLFASTQPRLEVWPSLWRTLIVRDIDDNILVRALTILES